MITLNYGRFITHYIKLNHFLFSDLIVEERNIFTLYDIERNKGTVTGTTSLSLQFCIFVNFSRLDLIFFLQGKKSFLLKNSFVSFCLEMIIYVSYVQRMIEGTSDVFFRTTDENSFVVSLQTFHRLYVLIRCVY